MTGQKICEVANPIDGQGKIVPEVSLATTGKGVEETGIV
jgi:hypothetical protein